MMATEVTGFVIDAIWKIALVGIGTFLATSNLPALPRYSVAFPVDNDLHDARRVTAADRVGDLLREGGLARIRESLYLCAFA